MPRAICVGINDYPGTGSDLAGCVNDAEDWAAELTRRGFDTAILLDSKATKAATVAAMTEVVAATGRDEIGVITYSGHGTWVPDDNGDEPDGRDEALCPYDLRTNGPLLDDDLFEVFAEQQPGARIVFISDSCHSGSVARLAPPLGDPAGAAHKIRFLPPSTFLGEAAIRRARVVETAPTTGLSRRTALLLAGCKDTEFSYDANFSDRPNGAFTYVALDALRKLPEQATYRDWMAQVRTSLPSQNYPQTPQLTGTTCQKKWPVLK
jgi:hypothetical protein